MAINLGGLEELNRGISSAEQLYFNLPTYLKDYISGKAPDSGGNRERDVKSYGRGLERGAKLYEEGRINALRQQRGAMNAGTPGNIPYEPFDPKNLSSDNNVAETPANISAQLGFGATSGPSAPVGGPNYIFDPSQTRWGWNPEAPKVNGFPTGRMSVWSFDQSTGHWVDTLDPNSVHNAVNASAAAQASQTERDEFKGAQQAPVFIRDNYTNAAKNAGTYSDTGEFGKGLDYEVGLGVEGANKLALDRINALRASRGASALNNLAEYVDPSAPNNPQAPINWPGTPATTGGGLWGEGVGGAPPNTNGDVVAPATSATSSVQSGGPQQLVDASPASVAPSSTGNASGSTDPTGVVSKPSTDPAEATDATSPNNLVSGASRVSRLRALKARSY